MSAKQIPDFITFFFSSSLLPLTCDRQLRDLVFRYNCIFGYTDLNIGRYVTFITHGRYHSKNPNLILKPAYCKTMTFSNRNVKPCNFICNLAPYDKFSSLKSFKKFLLATYFTVLDTTYNLDKPCAWFLSRNCPCHHS